MVVFDGVCNLCNFWVRWVHRRDAREVFRFASFDSAWATSRRLRPSSSPETLLVVAGERILSKSAAIVFVLRHSTAWSLRATGLAISLVPRRVSDFIYDFVASVRTRWFGKTDSCAWSPGLSPRRFLE